jgi:hypothetical protein
MFTNCSKTKQNPASMFGPYVYQTDPRIPTEKQPVIFTSLLGSYNTKATPVDLITLEGVLRGQDSSVQPYCRKVAPDMLEMMPQREHFDIPAQCDSALSTKVLFKCPNGHNFSSESCCSSACPCGVRCPCRDMWLGRNQVRGSCGAPRMSLK